MPQHDLDIANGSGAAVRADINSALLAFGTTMRGNSAPPNPQAGMMWLRDNAPSVTRWTLFMYDGADWISLGILDISLNRFEPASALPSFGGTLTGDVSMFKSNPMLALNGTAAGQAQRLAGYVNNALRWTFDLGEGASESGANAGSNARLARFTDGSGYIDDVFFANRQTGQVFVENLRRVWSENVASTLFQVAEAAWAGTFDPGTDPTWTTLIDQVLPDRCRMVHIGGYFRGQQTNNATNQMLIRARLMSSGLSQLAVTTLGVSATPGTAAPFVNNGLGGVFNPPDQNGMRVYIDVAKSFANGPFNVQEVKATFASLRRI